MSATLLSLLSLAVHIAAGALLIYTLGTFIFLLAVYIIKGYYVAQRWFDVLSFGRIIPRENLDNQP